MDPQRQLSLAASELIDNSFKNININLLEDFHVHALGLPTKNNKIWINPKLKSIFHPKAYLQYKIYLEAAGVRSTNPPVNQQIIDRMMDLVQQDRRYGKIRVLAFDYTYSLDGQKDLKNTTFYIPNKYVWNLYKQHPKKIVPVMSIHPYKKTALTELEFWGKRGIKMIKWLPSAQNIDPSSSKLLPYYRLLKKYNISLLAHTGEEQAMEAEQFQHLANPLLFKPALDVGVNVIMAHFASMGKCKDLEGVKPFKRVDCFSLVIRMFKNIKHRKNLFADISAITIFTHVGPNLGVLLNYQKFHHRLVNGSDYPLPAIDVLYQTGQLQKLGYLTATQAQLLDEIYKYNPLLFDFVLKRNLKHPKTGKSFLPSAFEVPNALR